MVLKEKKGRGVYIRGAYYQNNCLFFGESELINITRARGEEKNLSPRQELNPWPPEHPAGALSTELRELVESKVI